MPDTPSPTEPTVPESSIEPDSITVQTPSTVIRPSSTEETETQPVISSGKRSRGWLLLAVLILLIAGGAAIAYYVLPHNDNQATVAKTVTKRDIPALRYGLPDGDLTQFYPKGNSATSVQLNSQLFDGLVRYGQQTKIVPALATSWSNPNTSTWVFTLRKDVAFHSGHIMTAEDVKYSLDYAVAHQNDDPDNSNLTVASTIQKVAVSGNNQVTITTDGPDPILLNRLTFLYIMDAKGTIGDPDIGSGPYVVKNGSRPSAASIDLTANDHYYAGHVYTRALHIGIVTDGNQLAEDTNAGRFDLAGSLDKAQLAKIKHYQSISRQDLGVSFLGINTTRADSPLSAIEGRQAAAYALNIPAVLKAGDIRGEQASQLVPSALPGYDPSIKNRAYDPAKAKKLLAGMAIANNPITFSYAKDSGSEAYFNEIVKELTAVGFNVKASPIDDLNQLVDVAFSGKTDLFSITYDSATLDGLDVFNNILQGNDIYDNDEVDTLAKKAGSTIDPADRLALVQKISKIVETDIPAIPMYTPTDVFALIKPYYNVQVNIPSAWAGVYFWQVYQK